ncbi:MAG TPA: TIGR04282 family arsenosugar biosynthesis glycosyltransferase [Candidatus Kapabacteria bacterium]|nr:TIGR04282 family arsenosugar biosynthesis glycosyltransferase [Candidatus Kapabacteria bacterium]
MAAQIHSLHDTALLIFARYPFPGKVKTRLAKTLGDEPATAFYRACAEHAFQECVKLHEGITRYVFYSESSERESVMQWAGRGFMFADQGPGDLGERMRRAFRMVFDSGVRKAVIVGTDVPDISSGSLIEAIRSLDDADTVIGPSRDGGYYLLGMKKLHDEVFSDIEWSGVNVFTETMKQLEAKRLSVHKMPELADIDTEEDMRCWYTSAPQEHPLKDLVRSLLVHE